mmetsp:Transcript_50656/g.59155  ORF Transcript_50656/g.59155 Transcript_50656/m.59155 type:complete len:217 (-) Transcript_50656:472-1122(-)
MSQWKRKKKLPKEKLRPPPLNLVVVGNPCRINKDDSLSRYFDSCKHLIDMNAMNIVDDFGNEPPNNADREENTDGNCSESNWIDRFDCRSNIDALSLESNAAAESTSRSNFFLDDPEEKEVQDDLNFERFGLLPEYDEVFLRGDQTDSSRNKSNKVDKFSSKKTEACETFHDDVQAEGLTSANSVEDIFVLEDELKRFLPPEIETVSIALTLLKCS